MASPSRGIVRGFPGAGTCAHMGVRVCEAGCVRSATAIANSEALQLAPWSLRPTLNDCNAITAASTGPNVVPFIKMVARRICRRKSALAHPCLGRARPNPARGAVPFDLVTRRRTLLLCAPLLAALAACSGPGAATTGSSASPSLSTTHSGSTATPTPSTPSSAASTRAAPSAPAPQARTTPSLKKAVLAVSDMPSGFSQEPTTGGGSGGPTVSSRDPRCAELVVLMNGRSAPGSLAHAEASFSGGQSGPSIDESLDALGSSEKVAALQARLKSALARCSKVTMAIPGAGRSTMRVTMVNAPKVGAAPVAARVTGQGGPLDGFELTQVYTGVGDVVLAMTFVGAHPDDVEGATGLAHDKAASVLNITSAGAPN